MMTDRSSSSVSLSFDNTLPVTGPSSTVDLASFRASGAVFCGASSPPVWVVGGGGLGAPPVVPPEVPGGGGGVLSGSLWLPCVPVSSPMLGPFDPDPAFETSSTKVPPASTRSKASA